MNSNEHPETETLEAERPEQSAWERRFDKLQKRLDRYRDWFAYQPENHLVTTMILGLAVALGLFLVLKLVVMVVLGVVGWFTADTPPPPPEPASPLGTAISQLAHYTGDIALRWSALHPVGITDPALVLQLWLLIGAGLLLVVRTLPGLVLLTAWSTVSIWAFYTATPDANPVPAALLAGAIALACSTWWVLAGTLARLFR